MDQDEINYNYKSLYMAYELMRQYFREDNIKLEVHNKHLGLTNYNPWRSKRHE